MTAVLLAAAGGTALALWCGVVWWRKSVRPPQLEARDEDGLCMLTDVDVIIPARDEAAVIGRTLEALTAQGDGLRVLVVDDESQDGTAALAAAAGPSVEVIGGCSRPDGWTGKLWALEQGRARLERPYTLLLDADIGLAPGMLRALREKLEGDRLGFVSVLARPQLGTFAERLLMPAYAFFFELMYPFRRANDPASATAAAAGGCVLIRTELLHRLDAFRRIRGELIDDCALARLVKQSGAPTWVGLSHGARSLRGSGGWRGIHDLIARHAYTQLHYSPALLVLTTAVMLLMFALPPVLALAADTGALPATAGWPALGAWAIMALCYLPTLRYYRLSEAWAVLLPLIGLAYLGMVWSSAWRYHVYGHRASWRGRTYAIGSTP